MIVHCSHRIVVYSLLKFASQNICSSLHQKEDEDFERNVLTSASPRDFWSVHPLKDNLPYK